MGSTLTTDVLNCKGITIVL